MDDINGDGHSVSADFDATLNSIDPMMTNRSAIRVRDLACMVALVVHAVGVGAASHAEETPAAATGVVSNATQTAVTPAAHLEPLAGVHGPIGSAQHPRAGRCGGRHCGHGRCSHGACRNGGCEIPGCPANCPVRPATFGYYGTQWRSWPGHAVEQVSHAQPVAPVMPPKSEVPQADEESPIPGFESPEPQSEEAAAESERARPDAEPAPLPPPGEPEESESPPLPREPQTEAPKPAEENPADKPAEKKSDVDNLFDEAELQQRSRERLALLGQVAVQQDRLRRQALRQQATRLGRTQQAATSVMQATHVAPDPDGIAPQPVSNVNPLR